MVILLRIVKSFFLLVELQSPKKRVRLTETESTTPESQSLPPVDFDRDVRDPVS